MRESEFVAFRIFFVLSKTNIVSQKNVCGRCACWNRRKSRKKNEEIPAGAFVDALTFVARCGELLLNRVVQRVFDNLSAFSETSQIPRINKTASYSLQE